MNKTRENAHRIKSALWRHNNIEEIKLLAKILNYDEEQLREDIECLDEYIEQLENA